MADLKPVYRADTKQAAEMSLDEMEAKQGDKYEEVIRSWREKWHLLSAYFKYLKAVRKPIYTTNAVDAVHRQFRKLTNTKEAFLNENSLLKLFYIDIQQASEKWKMPVTNWGQTITQLSTYFEGRHLQSNAPHIIKLQPIQLIQSFEGSHTAQGCDSYSEPNYLFNIISLSLRYCIVSFDLNV